MKWFKSFLLILFMFAASWMTSCSVQKRTTAPGWHVENASKVFHHSRPVYTHLSLTKKELSPTTQKSLIPMRSKEFRLEKLALDTLAIGSKWKKQVRRFLRHEIKFRERALMFPKGLSAANNLRLADLWHEKAEKQCTEESHDLKDVAREEYNELERLRNPRPEKMEKLKRRRYTIITVVSCCLVIFFVGFISLLASFSQNPWGGG